ncbi:serine/threonine-protein kinase [Nostoc sp. 2RC]|uniref:serine/threonine protein kinase n=1 Tax=Nostoc sp. 2RC TaxID=2485484 RepID=UPI00162937FA|nr:serine/threonine-protein kinase [Nostoc sp. 2RC]MBC1241036.1 protein kinase [Nostoc sp. 2RC]
MKSPPSSNSWNGRFVGDNQRYRLDRRLGGGGMGEVFLATDIRVGQQVALKLLKDTLVASQEMRKRFEREVAVCAALQSDHIVKISDCGITPEGFPFYVMEYLRGQTLRQLLLREKRLPVERTVKIMAQACKGLQLAHKGVTLQREAGKTAEHIQVIHRDLKPDNIFLVPTDLGEWVKILDFGVAKIRSDSSENTGITNITSTFIGTFRYAPPEQIQSDKNLDARGDIYSLGIILYEMLSAADPFGISIKGNQISEASWVLAHAYEPPKPLREQPGCENLPEQLEAVVMKCLHKNPANRFASVEELDRSLQAAAKFATDIHSVPGRAIVQPPRPLHNQGSNHETVSNDDTILRPPAPYNQGSNHETVSNDDTILRPPVPYNQGSNYETVSNDDTILRPPAPYNQGSNYETIPRQSNDDTIIRPPDAYNQGSNYETSNDDTIIRPPDAYHQGSNYETINRSFNPVEQNQPQNYNSQQTPVNNPNPSKPDATLFQPRPASNQGGVQLPPDKTLFQPRPASNQGGVQLPPDKTLFQPRPVSHQNTPPVPTDKTLFQPRPVSNTNRPEPSLDKTLYQPRPVSHQNKPHVPTDETIYQPRLNQHSATGNTPNFLRILGIILAIGLTLGVVTFIYTQIQSSQNSTNEQSLSNSDRIHS